MVERIDQAYRESGNNLGWRFLSSPCDVLNGAQVAFIGLNPGGHVAPPDHAEFCMESGSAYVRESWAGHPAGQSPLQRQVRGLFTNLAVSPEKVLAGNLVPFRSPSWQALKSKQFSLGFGQQIWCEILAIAKPRLVVTMGREVFIALSEILEIEPEQQQQYDINWQGRYTVSGVSGSVRLVGLPHLSTYKIVGRERSEPALAGAFGEYWRK